MHSGSALIRGPGDAQRPPADEVAVKCPVGGLAWSFAHKSVAITRSVPVMLSG